MKAWLLVSVITPSFLATAAPALAPGGCNLAVQIHSDRERN
jgi:hypothetical protein